SSRVSALALSFPSSARERRPPSSAWRVKAQSGASRRPLPSRAWERGAQRAGRGQESAAFPTGRDGVGGALITVRFRRPDQRNGVGGHGPIAEERPLRGPAPAGEG